MTNYGLLRKGKSLVHWLYTGVEGDGNTLFPRSPRYIRVKRKKRCEKNKMESFRVIQEGANSAPGSDLDFLIIWKRFEIPESIAKFHRIKEERLGRKGLREKLKHLYAISGDSLPKNPQDTRSLKQGCSIPLH